MTEHWYTSDRFRACALTFLVIALIAQAFPTLLRDNDYVWHTGVGSRFLEGDPYSSGCEWYPLSRTMFNAIPASLSKTLGKALFALVALGCLYGCFRAFTEMTREQFAWDPRRNFAACTFGLIAMAPFINRDLDEAGLQCLLLGMLALGGWALWRGQRITSGFWLGSAVAYKFTPILFLPLLLWKREWRAAAALVVVAVSWNVLPAAYLGWDKTLACQEKWWQRMVSSTRIEDIAENGIEPPSHANQALMAGFARYLRVYPPGHRLHLENPLSLTFGDFDQDTARAIAKGCILALGLAIAWGMRRAWRSQDPRMPYEWAVACIFTALMSPMCWRQHLALALPAGILLWRSVLAGPKISWTLFGQALVLGGMILAPQRELWGAEFTDVLLTYKLDTLALLGYTAMLFRLAPAASQAQQAAMPVSPAMPTANATRQAA